MLEEVLKNINSNLEKIANTLEDSDKLLRENFQVRDAKIVKILADGKDIMPTPKPQVQTTTGLAPVQQSVLIQDKPAVTGVVSQAPVQTIPTTPVQEGFTQEQLAVAMSNAVAAGKMNAIQGILQQLGVQALTQVNPADYNKLAVMLKEAGVNI